MRDCLSSLCQDAQEANEHFDIYYKMSRTLGCTMSEAKERVKKWGWNRVYSKTGSREYNRENLKFFLVTDGCVFIIYKDGSTQTRYHKPAKPKRYRHSDEFYAAMRGYPEMREDRERERMFKDCQTNPQPKRGGRANSHDDIGKYVNRRNRGANYEMRKYSEVRYSHIKLSKPIEV